MPNNQTSMQTIFGSILSFAKEKTIPFFKQGLLIPFIFASLLYILMRVFFIGAEFDLNESVELYVKTFLVTWAYINAFRLICFGIIWLEAKSTKATLAKIVSLPILKKTAILIIIAGLTYSVKAKAMNVPAQKHAEEIGNNSEAYNDVDPRCYMWMK